MHRAKGSQYECFLWTGRCTCLWYLKVELMLNYQTLVLKLEARCRWILICHCLASWCQRQMWCPESSAFPCLMPFCPSCVCPGDGSQRRHWVCSPACVYRGKAVGFQIKPPALPSPHILLGEPSKVSIIHLSLQAQTGCLEKQVLSQGFWQVLKYFLLCDWDHISITGTWSAARHKNTGMRNKFSPRLIIHPCHSET